MKPTLENYNNLKTLRDFIAEKVSPEHFDMENFRTDSKESVSPAEFKSMNDCGTIGCALGWLPFALNMTDEDIKSYLFTSRTVDSVSFYKLSEVKLGINKYHDEYTWDYLFSSEHAFRNYTGTGFSGGMPSKYSGEEQKAAFLKRVDIILSGWKNIVGVKA